MSNLFIVGNGFDLAHGLKTSYRHFREFLVQIEKEECAEAGEVSISENRNLLKDDNIKDNFNNIVIPAMEKTLSETINILQLKDCYTGKTTKEQMDEIDQFLNDANKIIQWIKHGSGQYYAREKKESNAIRRFISMLEPETGIISRTTNLNNDFCLFKTIESEFGNNAVKFLQIDNSADKVPLWLTLRLLIKMIDLIEGENWNDLETSMGTYNFELIFKLFNKLESNDDIYKECVKKYFIDLYYDIKVLFNSWIIFTEIAFEYTTDNDNIFSSLCPSIKKKNNDIELSFKIPKDNYNRIYSQVTFDRHPMAKNQLLQLFEHAKHNYFFSFNYTHTLEHFYNISEKDICHIHGMTQGSKNLNDRASENLIFGHGLDFYKTNITDVVRTAYNITKKPINQCIENNLLFFEKLEGVNNIFSYGFSFSDVDMSYINKICESIRNTADITWYFNDYRIEENRMVFEEKIRKTEFIGKFDTFHID